MWQAKPEQSTTQSCRESVESFYTWYSSELTSSADGYSYAYDNNGNTLTKSNSIGNTHYGWDFDNRLTQVVLPGSDGTVTFRYDPFGRRIQKVSGNGVTNYLYDIANSVEERDSAGNVVVQYARSLGVDQSLAENRSGAVRYYEQDALGSVTSLTTVSAGLDATYNYDSYGHQTMSSGTLAVAFHFTGRDFDPETNLQYNRARYYDPQIARFVSSDPIRFGGGMNFYSYASNNPSDFIDPSGLAPCLDIPKFVQALDNNAQPHSTSKCGRYVGKALKAGGIDVGNHDGKDYGPYLKDAGFSEVSPDNYDPLAGDVVVIQPYPEGNPAGHVEGFDGTHYVSDFVQPQPGVYPGQGYRDAQPQPAYAIYRPTPCPTSTAEQDLLQMLFKWASQR